MTILAIDTSGPSAGAAVYRDGEILAEVFTHNGLTHSQTIMPAVEHVCQSADVLPGQVDLFACVVGPGSFTGVRIGVCAARGMAHAVHKPCIAIDALEALAHGAFGFQGAVCPMLDARRSQVYCAAFLPGEVPVRLLPDDALPLEQFFDALPEDVPLLFVGEAAPLHAQRIHQRFGSRGIVAPSHFLHVRPAAAADLAGRRDASAYVAPELLLPLYLRAPSAQREREERLRSAGEGQSI